MPFTSTVLYSRRMLFPAFGKHTIEEMQCDLPSMRVMNLLAYIILRQLTQTSQKKNRTISFLFRSIFGTFNRKTVPKFFVTSR